MYPGISLLVMILLKSSVADGFQLDGFPLNISHQKFITIDRKRKDENKTMLLEDNKKNVTVLVGNMIPFIFYKEVNRTGGYVGSMWYAIEQYLQFNPTFINDSKKEVLQNGSADISLIPLYMQSKYYDKYDCTVSLGKRWFNFYLNGENLRSRMIYSSIWSTGMTLTVFGHIVGIMLVQYGMNQYSSNGNGEPAKKMKYHTRSGRGGALAKSGNVGLVFLHVFGLCLLQGPQLRPAYRSAKLLNVLCSLFGLLMFTSYNAVLVARITATQRLTSLRGLVSDREFSAAHYSVCIGSDNYAYKSLQKVKTDEDTQFLMKWKDKINKYPCAEPEAGVATVGLENFCKGSTLVLEEHHVASLRIVQGEVGCRLVRDSNAFYSSHISLALRKGFLYKEDINLYLIKLQSYGIMSRIKQFWLPAWSEMDDVPNYMDYSMSFPHIKYLVSFYVKATVCSILFLILELIIHKFNLI